MDAEVKAQLIAAVRDAASITEVYKILDIEPGSSWAQYVEIVWEALC